MGETEVGVHTLVRGCDGWDGQGGGALFLYWVTVPEAVCRFGAPHASAGRYD